MSTFAEKHLQNQGWSKGEGLGRNKTGIKKAISVSKKNNTHGVGAKNDNYEFPWWDHVYNSVSSTVKIENENGDVLVKSTKDDSIEKNKMGIISTERPTGNKVKSDGIPDESAPVRILDAYQRNVRNALYGYFVKSSLNEFKTDDFITKISDEALFEACGRLTARKGARAEQSGKFDRTMTNINIKSTMISHPNDEESSNLEEDATDVNNSEKVKKSKKKEGSSKDKKSKKSKKRQMDSELTSKKVKKEKKEKIKKNHKDETKSKKEKKSKKTKEK